MELAERDKRIRAILLQGSRANNNIIPDQLQDYDVLLIVDQMESFLADPDWTSIFGERIIWQLPDEMDIGKEPNHKDSFHYLMLFTDGNRIDLTLFPSEKMGTRFTLEGPTVLWLDKYGLMTGVEVPEDKDYWIRKPSEKEFAECCNEFWWVSTYISKGLLRDEITYAKAMMEGPVRLMFMRMIAWFIGTQTGFSVSVGKEGKFMKNHLDKESYERILKTYPDHQAENIWNAIFLMTSLFSQYALWVSEKLQFTPNLQEAEGVMEYLLGQYAGRRH
jgi:aminoglycoside 6-adenylyltransferase